MNLNAINVDKTTTIKVISWLANVWELLWNKFRFLIRHKNG